MKEIKAISIKRVISSNKEKFYIREHYIIMEILLILLMEGTGYSITQETFNEEIEAISATKIRNEQS